MASTEGGYAGRILRLDLSSGEHEVCETDLDEARKLIGGAGLNHRLLADIHMPGLDPLAPDAPLLLGAGPLVGLPIPSAAKFQATAKFPHPADARRTKYFIGSAISGSRRFSLNLKHAGYDAFVLTGRAPRPVYLLVGPGEVSLRPATELWGRADVYETTDRLMDLHPGAGVVAIGAAGERLVRFSLAITDKTSTLGRNGLGAAFGSKNLKAIVTLPGGSLRAARPAALVRQAIQLWRRVKLFENLRDHQRLGLHASWRTYRETMNPGLWEKREWDRYYGPDKAAEAIAANLPCTGCALACRAAFPVEDEAGRRLTHTGTFLHLGMIGQASGMRDWREAALLMDLCNRVGMSVVEFRGIIRFLLASGGGDSEVKGLGLGEGLPGYRRLLQAMLARQGVGEAASEGWWVLSERMGADTRDYVMQVKGAACTYDARQTKMDAPRFSMVVNPRGAMHGQAHSATSVPLRPVSRVREELTGMGATEEEMARALASDDVNVARLTKHAQDGGLAFDSLGVCIMYRVFGLFYLDTLAGLYSAATGFDVDAHELAQAGERGFNLLKVLNAREGFDRADDAFPAIWFKDKQTADGTEALLDYYRRRRIGPEEASTMLDEYYDERGWDRETGLPSAATLRRLGIDEL